jgi:hypothetical protein
LLPIGADELTIEAVNNGSKFLTAPQEFIDKNELITATWKDTRFTNAAELKSVGEIILNRRRDSVEEFKIELAHFEAFDSRDKEPEYEIESITDFNYTGQPQTYVVTPGTYFIESFGASGGDIGIFNGGLGGETSGYIQFDKSLTLYLCRTI